MTRKTKMLLAGAALTGLLSGSAGSLFAATPTAPARASVKSIDSAGARATKLADEVKDEHSCKGKNTCKGHGGCKSGDNGCKGKNSCKGHGGCSTMPKTDK